MNDSIKVVLLILLSMFLMVHAVENCSKITEKGVCEKLAVNGCAWQPPNCNFVCGTFKVAGDATDSAVATAKKACEDHGCTWHVEAGGSVRYCEKK